MKPILPRRVSDTLCALGGALFAGLLATVADAAVRSPTPQVSAWWQWAYCLAVLIPAASVLGLMAVLLRESSLWLSSRWKHHRWAVLSACALLAGALAYPLLQISLLGLSERSPDTARWVLLGASGALGAGAFILSWLVWTCWERAAHGAILRPALLAGALVVVGFALMLADLSIGVALYARLHWIAEAIAWLCVACGGALALLMASRRSSQLASALAAVTALAILWTAWFSGSPFTRHRLDEALIDVWHEPLYTGRMAVRLQLVSDYLSDPGGWESVQDARLARLVKRYDIATMEQSGEWALPRKVDVKPPSAKARPPLNVVVFFVDTLRADTARNPAVMPRLAQLREESLDFVRAYSAASDTVTTLPVLTGGCYGKIPCEGDLLRVAREQGVRSGLFIARSAREFLGNESPHFKFDDVVDATDYDDTREKVWGYGAKQPTAHDVVRSALDWIDSRNGEQFFAWAFHFDVHNWMHIDPAYLATAAERFGIEQTEGDRRWRYPAAAAGVDHALGQFLDGLEARGLDQNTAILFVSDHGEGLGQRNHDYHAVFLWESLIRVPLVLKVPGVEPRQVWTLTGHPDVAPTLVSLLSPNADISNYHGSSLLDEDKLQHALPLLLLSLRKQDLMRVGIVDRQNPDFKLELPMETVEPELYNLADSTPDDRNVRLTHERQTLSLLSRLVTSPVFPRPKESKPKKQHDKPPIDG